MSPLLGGSLTVSSLRVAEKFVSAVVCLKPSSPSDCSTWAACGGLGWIPAQPDMLLGKQEEAAWSSPREPGNAGHIVARGFPTCKLSLNKHPSQEHLNAPFSKILLPVPANILWMPPWGGGAVLVEKRWPILREIWQVKVTEFTQLVQTLFAQIYLNSDLGQVQFWFHMFLYDQISMPNFIKIYNDATQKCDDLTQTYPYISSTANQIWSLTQSWWNRLGFSSLLNF